MTGTRTLACAALALLLAPPLASAQVRPAVYEHPAPQAVEIEPAPAGVVPQTIQPASYEVHFHAPLDLEPVDFEPVDLESEDFEPVSVDSTSVLTPVSFRRHGPYGAGDFGYRGCGVRPYTYYPPAYGFGRGSSLYRPWYSYSRGYSLYRPWYSYAPGYWTYRRPYAYRLGYRYGYGYPYGGLGYSRFGLGYSRLGYGLGYGYPYGYGGYGFGFSYYGW